MKVSLLPVLIALLLSSCRTDSPGDTSGPAESVRTVQDCASEPLPAVEAFLPGEPARLRSFQATLASVESVPDLDFLDLTLQGPDGSGVLRVTDPGDPWPVPAGSELKFTIEVAPGFPSASALVIEDADGLRFASVADLSLGAQVLAGGLPGVMLESIDLECASRGSGRCFESITNRALSVVVDDEQIVLAQGQTGRVGPYRIQCRVAQDVVYTRDCADAGVHGISFVLTRVEEPR